MKKYTTLLLILFCCIISSFEIKGQNSNFKIEGIINVDSGKIIDKNISIGRIKFEHFQNKGEKYSK